jgi:hypothetical protein
LQGGGRNLNAFRMIGGNIAQAGKIGTPFHVDAS